MTNPNNPVHGSAGSTGSAVDDQRHHAAIAADVTSPWRSVDPTGADPVDSATAVHAAPGEDTATTTSLPVIGGPHDPFATGQAANLSAARPVAQPVSPPPPPVTPGPRPRSAVDQYAAMAGNPPLPPVVPHVAPAVPTAMPPGMRSAAPPRAPVPPGVAVGAAAGAVAAGAPPVAKVRPAKAIRKPKSGAARSPRRAKLQVRHLNVWSVLRFSCVLAIALFFVWLIMVGVLYGILDVTHVFDKVNETVRDINGDTNSKNVITPGIVFGGAFVIGLVNIVLFIALSTIGSIVYNLCADLVGGIEVTLAEHE